MTKKSKKTKILIISAIVVVVLIIIAVVGKKAGFIGKSYQIKVSTELVEKRTIEELITANGKVQPQTEVKISADVSGEIVELYVKEGQEVEKGELLLKINPDIYLSTLDKMTASLNSTKANLANSKAYLSQIKSRFINAELSFKRQEKLYKQGVTSKSEFETATAEYEVAKAEVDASQQSVIAARYNVLSSQASLKEARENYNKTSIYSPVTGTISMLNVELGERVVGTMQMQGTEILRIANLNNMEVQVDVNENDIIRVTKGDTALIEIDAYLEEDFIGIVTEIAHSANVSGTGSDQVTNFEVKIIILQESYQHLIPENDTLFYPFRPGMSATVDIKTETKNNVLSIPIQAVTTRTDSVLNMNSDTLQTTKTDENTEESKINNDELQIVVFVYNEDTQTVAVKKVETGIQDNQYIEIIKGLSENEEIVVAPYLVVSKKLKNKQEVLKVKKEKLFE